MPFIAQSTPVASKPKGTQKIFKIKEVCKNAHQVLWNTDTRLPKEPFRLIKMIGGRTGFFHFKNNGGFLVPGDALGQMFLSGA